MRSEAEVAFQTDNAGSTSAHSNVTLSASWRQNVTFQLKVGAFSNLKSFQINTRRSQLTVPSQPQLTMCYRGMHTHQQRSKRWAAAEHNLKPGQRSHLWHLHLQNNSEEQKLNMWVLKRMLNSNLSVTALKLINIWRHLFSKNTWRLLGIYQYL